MANSPYNASLGHSPSQINASELLKPHLSDPRGEYSQGIKKHETSIPLNSNSFIKPAISTATKLSNEEKTFDSKSTNHHINEPIKSNSVNFYPSSRFGDIDHPADRNILVSCFLTLIFLILSITISAPILAIMIPILCFAVIIRWSIAFCCCCRHDYLSHNELRWISSRVPVLILLVLENKLEIDKIRELFLNRIVSAQDKHGKRMYPRFLQKVSALSSGYVWVEDDVFQIEDHINPINSGSVNDIENILSSLSESEMDLDRPLWDIHVITTADPVSQSISSMSTESTRSESLLIIRAHPSMIDGISMVHLFCYAFSDDQSTLILKPRFSASCRIFNSIRSCFVGPMVFLQKWLFTRRDYNIFHPPSEFLSSLKTVTVNNSMSSFSPQKQRAFHFRSYSLSKINRLKQVSRSTYNDLFLAVFAGALRAYQQARGIENPFDLLTLIAVDSTREKLISTDDISKEEQDRKYRVKLRNNYVFVDLCLPVNTEGMIPRLWEVRQRMDELKNSADPLILQLINSLVYKIFPESMANAFASTFTSKASVCLVNLQGPGTSMNLGSKEIKGLAFWYPPVGDVNLSISFFSYTDRLYYAVSADEHLVPKIELITAAISKQFDTLAYLLENRRIPGEHKMQRQSDGQELPVANSNLTTGAGDLLSPNNDPLSSPTASSVTSAMTADELHIRLARLQLRLQDPDTLPPGELDSLRNKFSQLMFELKHLKKIGADGSESEPADFDEDIDFEQRARRRSSLGTMMALGSRRKSIGSALTRPLNVGGSRGRSLSISSRNQNLQEDKAVQEDSFI